MPEQMERFGPMVRRVYVAVSMDAPEVPFKRLGVYAYALEDEMLAPLSIASNEASPTELPATDVRGARMEGEDPVYAAIEHCAGRVPDGACIEVILTQEHYVGGAGYLGSLNLSPEQHRARGYTNKDGRMPLDCAEHLRRLHAVLETRGLRAIARRPDDHMPAEEAVLKRCKKHAASARHKINRLA